MKARYTVIDGEVVYQNRGGTKHLYFSDPLGSVAALYDTNHTKTDTFGYWPYGEEVSRTGSTPVPFQFIGSRGHYRDNSARDYVRMRTLAKGYGRWLTKDPVELIDGPNPYQYCLSNPTTLVDPSGLRARNIGPGEFWECYHRLKFIVSPKEACERCKAVFGTVNMIINFNCDSPIFEGPSPPRPIRPCPPAIGVTLPPWTGPFPGLIGLTGCYKACRDVGGFPSDCRIFCRRIWGRPCDWLFPRCFNMPSEYWAKICMSVYLGGCFGN